MLSTLERLAKAKALRAATLSADAASKIGDRIIFERQAEGLRALLLGQRENTIADLDLFNPADSLAVIRDYYGGLSDADDTTRIQSAEYLKIVADYLARVDAQTRGLYVSEEGDLAAGVQRMLQAGANSNSTVYIAAQLARLSDAGQHVYAVPQQLIEADAQFKECENQIGLQFAQLSADKMAEWDAMTVELADLKRASAESWDLEVAGRLTFDEAMDIRTRYMRRHAQLVTEVEAVFKPKEDALRQKRLEAMQQQAAAAAAIKRDVLDNSIVSQETADAWANAQTITPGAKAALKRKGYPAEQVRGDMAEFYRLTAGRLPGLTIRTSRGRASAEGIHGHGSSIINMGASFGKRTLFHEMGHHLEADPAVFAAAKGFLHKRRESEATYSLRKLTGNNGYKSSELAYKDSFFDPYVGKFYPYNVTEVISMGVESFCDDTKLAHRLRTDPEHYALITGFMKTPPDPLFGSVKKVLTQIADAEKEVADETEVEKDDALSKLGAGVEFVKVDPEPEVPYFLSVWKGTYVGSYSDVHLYQCSKLRDRQTRRSKKGYALVAWSERESSGRRSLRYETYFEGMDQVKAAAMIWSKSQSLEPLRAPEAIMKFAEAYGS